MRCLSIVSLLTAVTSAFKCGKVPLDDALESRLVGGHAPAEGVWPFVAHVRNTVSGSTCSGSIVGRRHVLTAGHCIGNTYGSTPVLFNASYFVVRTRSVSRRQGNERTVKNIFPGPLWYRSRNTNVDDIAILELKEPIEFDDYAQPICLPKSFRERPGDPGYFVGWGIQNKVPEPHNETVDYDRGPVVANENIVTFRKGSHCRTSRRHLHREDYICAGQNMHLANRGDSGGPLMVNRKGIWFQVGTDSYGLKRDGRGWGMFARATSYCKWISDVTNGEVKCI